MRPLFRNFSKSSFSVYDSATRRGVHPHDGRAAAFPSPGREIQEGSWRSAAETRGIVPRKSPGEDLAARSAVCTRVMICGRPDRDPVRPAGWLAEQRGHPRFPGTRPPRGVRSEEGRTLRPPPPSHPLLTERKRSAGPDYAEGVMDGLICEI